MAKLRPRGSFGRGGAGFWGGFVSVGAFGLSGEVRWGKGHVCVVLCFQTVKS